MKSIVNMENTGRLQYPDLPDEREYPEELTERCELLECFSSGNSTETLLARDKASDRLYVVKCFFSASPLYDRTEPETLCRLDERPFPRFIAEYRNFDMRCVLREYVEGETLARIRQYRTFSQEEIMKVGMQLCDQLTTLHRQNPPVIHRDIKPQNVVMRPDGQAVLIDFGIARVLSENETDTVAFGTQGFAPPEQYGYAQTDERSDLYSLGILLSWMLTGDAAPPKKADTPLLRVLSRCTVFDPKGRYSSAQQVRKALAQTDPAHRRKQLAFRWSAAAAAVFLIAAGTVYFQRNLVKTVSFSDPLLESAVRLNLGIDEKTKLTEDMLCDVTAVYVVADQAYADPDSFYPAISRWYADGMSVRGTIKTLDDLTQLTSLEQVCLVAQKLEDISAIEDLEELNKVEFKHNYITDISALRGMEHLTSVGINDNPVTNLSPLTDCPNLAFLDLCDVRTYDPKIIEELGNFDYLDLSNPTESYRYLGSKSILALHLAWTSLEDLHVLDEVTRLEELDISHTNVTDLSALAIHTGLKQLNIAAVPADDLGVLTLLPQLETVTISKDMEPLAEKTREIHFSWNVE